MKRTVSSLRRTQAIFSREESAAVSSRTDSSVTDFPDADGDRRPGILTCKSANILELGAESHLEGGDGGAPYGCGRWCSDE